MRSFVEGISAYAKAVQPNFIVIAQNGPDLLTSNGKPNGELVAGYANALDGQGQEHPFYGQDRYDKPTKPADRDYYVAFLDRAEQQGIKVLVTDYCSTHAYIDDAYAQALAHYYVSFAAYGRNYDLDNIPPYPAEPFGVNANAISSLGQVFNFLYLIDPDSFPSRRKFVRAVRATNYDLLISDAYYNGRAFTPAQVAELKHKANGGTRLVIAYVNIGAAENWRYYWQPGWTQDNPAFLAGKYEGYPDERWARYWFGEWQAIIFGNDASYVKRIIDATFDGIYLDNILAYEYFEKGR
jgi:cysteinyl-tRNA synthetase